MNSMTGFGRGIVTTETGSFQVEIKTVNTRYCDITIKSPKQFNVFEDKVRRLIQNAFQRGKVEVAILYKESGEQEKELRMNRALCGQIKQFLLDEGFYADVKEVPLSAIMSISSDWITIEEPPTDEEAIGRALEAATKLAIDGVLAMRAKEGIAMKEDIMKRLQGIETLFSYMESRRDIALIHHEERLLQRIQTMLDKVGVDFQEERFMQEVAILSDKVDISEEIARFASHVLQLKEILEEEGPIGRKLDFLLQEMNREVNTMGSKGNEITIVDTVVQLKVELEKVREQIQNIE